MHLFHCHICGTMEARQVSVDEVFVIDGKHVLVEGISADACARCGEATFSRETTERIRRMVHGEAHPVRAVTIGVFAYAEGYE